MGENFHFKTCFIVVQSDDGEYPWYLRATPGHRKRLGGGDESEDNLIVCLKWFSRIHGPQNQFATVHVLDEKAINNRDVVQVQPSDIVLCATPAFVRHYRLDVASSVHGFRVKNMSNNLVPLVSVTVSVNDEVVYGRLSDTTSDSGVDWTTRLLLNACRGPVLCRRGDVLPLLNNKDYGTVCCTVLDCEPVDQGVLVPSTSLTIVQTTSSESPTTDSTTTDGEVRIEDPPCRPRRKPDFVFYLSVLVDTAKLFSTVHHSNNTKLSKPSPNARLIRIAKLLAIAFAVLQSWRLKFRVHILARNPIRIGSKLSETLDLFRTVFVSSNVLRRHALPDLSLSLASLDPSSDGGGQDCKQRLVRLCSIERHAADLNLSEFGHLSDGGVCCLTPLLWYNLNGHPSTLVQPDTKLVIKKYSANCSPTYAHKIQVSLVQSPRHDDSIDCNPFLCSYFLIPRLMSLNDVFCLQVGESPSSQAQPQSLSVDGMLRSELSLAYFRVSKIDGDSSFGYLVDRSHTFLYERAVSHSYVPNTMEDFWSSNILHPIWDSPIPTGFHRFCCKLTDTVLPYLKSVYLRRDTAVTVCLVAPRGAGKMTVIKALTRQLNLHVVVVNCWELIGDSAGATASRIQTALQKATSYVPCCVVMKDIHLIGKDDNGIANGESRIVYAFKEALAQLSRECLEHPVVIIGTTTDSSLLEPDLASLFLHFLEIEASSADALRSKVCDVQSRSEILNVLLSPLNVGLQVSLPSLVQRTSGFVLGDLCALINRAFIAAHRRITALIYIGNRLMSPSEESDICLAGPRILNCDFDDAFAEIQSALSVAIGAPKIPIVKWEDIGGLEHVKAEILDTVQLPLQHPELLATGMRRSGVLLYGPPGTGKTLLAKAVATECSLNFLSVKGPELINMYVGQSEENVRKIFQAARSAAPCIIFFDELDSLAPNRGRSGDSGGVMDRVVSQLLSEMDGLHCKNDVFVMGATNRPDLLDPALLRPGRFDKSLYVGICSEKSAQHKILTALTRKFHLTEDVNLVDIVDMCPSNLTGADFYALCSAALLSAISREIQYSEMGTRKSDANLSVTSQDFAFALKNLTPSVSDEQLRNYTTVMQKMQQ